MMIDCISKLYKTKYRSRTQTKQRVDFTNVGIRHGVGWNATNPAIQKGFPLNVSSKVSRFERLLCSK